MVFGVITQLHLNVFHIQKIDNHDGKNMLSTTKSITRSNTIIGTTITYCFPCTTMTMADLPIISFISSNLHQQYTYRH
jgi:hypothetical protein